MFRDAPTNSPRTRRKSLGAGAARRSRGTASTCVKLAARGAKREHVIAMAKRRPRRVPHDEVTGQFIPIHGHGGTHSSPTYESWAAMLSRTRNRADYMHVSVDPSWRSFERFLADMGERPPGTTIDRIDGARGYKKSNCRWATYKEQARNRTNNKPITFAGVTRCLSAWAEHLELPVNVLANRFRRGWTVEEAFSAPKRVYGIGVRAAGGSNAQREAVRQAAKVSRTPIRSTSAKAQARS